MKLPAIFGFCVLGIGCLTPNAQSSGQPPAIPPDSSTQQTQSSDPQPKEQPQTSEPTQAAPAVTGKTTNPTVPAKQSPAKSPRHKKVVTANCSNTLPATNAAVGNPAGSTDPGTGTPSSTPALPPCPPPKKVVRNGGSTEPAIQLVGGATGDQAAHQSSTDELTAATEENLKKLAGRQLSASEQDTVSQIKQFMGQSKTAIDAGDAERSHNLAMKAHLLSDELVKP